MTDVEESLTFIAVELGLEVRDVGVPLVSKEELKLNKVLSFSEGA